MNLSKKVLFYFTVLTFLTISHAQTNWSVAVIDSFNTTNVGQGIWGLNSTVHDNAIHLTYYYHSIRSETTLLYAVSNGGGFTVDTVAHISGFNSYGVSTSIQFNSDGTKWIYAGFYSYPNRIIGVFKENGANWDYEFIDATGNFKTVNAIRGNQEIGFVYSSLGSNQNISQQHIKYAFWNGSQWNITTISDRGDTWKTSPTIVEAGGKIYLTYSEGRYPDSLLARVFVKENQTWQESFTDLLEIPYAGGAIDGLSNLLGATSDGMPALLHSLSDEVLPSYFMINGGNWRRTTINYPDPQILTHRLYGSNILFDDENTMFTISQSAYSQPRLSWVKEDGSAGYSDIPFKYGIILQDFVIFDGKIYVYYFDGFTSYPYDRPSTFKEAQIDINTLLTDVQGDREVLASNFELYQNYPNPFNPTTTIGFSVPSNIKSETGNVKLVVYDILGREVITLVNERKLPGNYKVKFDAGKLSSGMYFCTLSNGSYKQSKKMILLK